MCFYTYYYYGECKHFQQVLVDFCDLARVRHANPDFEAAAAAAAADIGTHMVQQEPLEPHGNRISTSVDVAPPDLLSADSPTELLLSHPIVPCSTALAQQHQPRSHVSSIPQSDNQSPHSSDIMSFPTFDDRVRHWINSGITSSNGLCPADIPHRTNVPEHSLPLSSNIGNDSDKSHSLSSSSGILEHLANDGHDLPSERFATDDSKLWPHNGNHGNEAFRPFDLISELDRLSGDLDGVKEEVELMKRQEVENAKLVACTSISPATLLQNKLEQSLREQVQAQAASAPRHDVLDNKPISLCLSEFPSLHNTTVRHDEEQTRTKRVVSGTTGALYSSILSGLEKACKELKSTPQLIHNAAIEAEDVDTFQYRDSAISTTPCLKTNNESEVQDFVEISQSYTQPISETLRKGLVSQTVKHTPDSSVKKSTRAYEPYLFTDKRAAQRQQKRMSLPDSWFGTAGATLSKTSNVPNSLPTSPTKSKSIGTPLLRKKLSSYLSPTKATSQRAAVVDKENAQSKRSRREKRDTESRMKSAGPASASFPKIKDHTVKLGKKSSFVGNRPPSPSKIPRPIYSAPISRVPTFESDLSGLPQIANTTTRRKTSHADILQPILTRLDTEGLRKDHPSETGIPGVQIADQCVVKTRARQQSDAHSLASLVRASRPSSVANTIRSPVIVTIRPNALEFVPRPLEVSSQGVAVKHDKRPNVDSDQSRGRIGSLRATAQEFKPMRTPELQTASLAQLPNWNIDCQVELEENGYRFERQPRPLPDASMYWGPATGFENKHFPLYEGHEPEASSPRKRHVRWSADLGQGSRPVLNLGRAPVPSLSSDVETPSVSPKSSMTPSWKSPGSNGAWTIGSGQKYGTFNGWKGGDGKEISFSGYGPQVEVDPNRPVRMGFKASGARTTRDNYRGMSPTPKVWPRSRRQWAELAGYEMMPCGNVEYIEAMELIPGAYGGFGTCATCTEKLGA